MSQAARLRGGLIELPGPGGQGPEPGARGPGAAGCILQSRKTITFPFPSNVCILSLRGPTRHYSLQMKNIAFCLNKHV